MGAGKKGDSLGAPEMHWQGRGPEGSLFQLEVACSHFFAYDNLKCRPIKLSYSSFGRLGLGPLGRAQDEELCSNLISSSLVHAGALKHTTYLPNSPMIIGRATFHGECPGPGSVYNAAYA